MTQTDLVLDTLIPYSQNAFVSEQDKLATDRDAVLLRPKARPLFLMKATSLGEHKVGRVFRVYDSIRTREITLAAGFIPCEGQSFDGSRFPELKAWLGKAIVPLYTSPGSST